VVTDSKMFDIIDGCGAVIAKTELLQ